MRPFISMANGVILEEVRDKPDANLLRPGRKRFIGRRRWRHIESAQVALQVAVVEALVNGEEGLQRSVVRDIDA